MNKLFGVLISFGSYGTGTSTLGSDLKQLISTGLRFTRPCISYSCPHSILECARTYWHHVVSPGRLEFERISQVHRCPLRVTPAGSWIKPTGIQRVKRLIIERD